jgi:hypothetical protein
MANENELIYFVNSVAKMRLEEWKGFLITSLTAQFYIGVLSNYSILKPDLGQEFNFSESYIGTESSMYRAGRDDQYVYEGRRDNLSLERKKNKVGLLCLHPPPSQLLCSHFIGTLFAKLCGHTVHGGDDWTGSCERELCFARYPGL